MCPDNVVPDPKSGRDGNPQNPKVVQKTADFLEAARERINRLTHELTIIRGAMNELQQLASKCRSKYECVPTDLREGLIASRECHRIVSAELKSIRIEYFKATLAKEEEE